MHINALHSMLSGMRACDFSCEAYPLMEGYRPCDVTVTFGVHKRRTPRGRAVGAVLDAHQKYMGHDARSLIVERGFIHRDRYYMVGWGGLNGRADYCNHASPIDRWSALNVTIHPWRTTGEHIVLCGQVPWDASVQHVDHVRWCKQTARRLRRLTRRSIVFRPHPMARDAVKIGHRVAQLSTADTLQEEMRSAWAVVTFNSNAGVEATLAGVPAFVADRGAMGYSILNKNLDDIEYPYMPDREQWSYNLAYAQWTLPEIAEGLAIRHLYCMQNV